MLEAQGDRRSQVNVIIGGLLEDSPNASRTCVIWVVNMDIYPCSDSVKR